MVYRESQINGETGVLLLGDVLSNRSSRELVDICAYCRRLLGISTMDEWIHCRFPGNRCSIPGMWYSVPSFSLGFRCFSWYFPVWLSARKLNVSQASICVTYCKPSGSSDFISSCAAFVLSSRSNRQQVPLPQANVALALEQWLDDLF
jgi:hypothetical protein